MPPWTARRTTWKSCTQPDRRRRTIVDGLNAIEGVNCPVPTGAFYAYPDVRELLGKEIEGVRPQTTELAEPILEKAQVAVVPGEAFGPSGYLRLLLRPE